MTQFQPGDWVDVIGKSKGKGFQGVMKKHNFHGQGAAHGSKTHRRNGAIGNRSTPGRIWKNMGMPGHMGDERVTVQNLQVLQVREADKVILISGAVPGAKGSYVVVRPAFKKRLPQPRRVNERKSFDRRRREGGENQFDRRWRGSQAVHDVVVAMRAARRSGSANSKTKAKVNLSGAKPWRQKGTGRARAGYKSSPVWRGGGVVFGPKPRDYSKKVSKTVRRLAFQKALSERINAGDVLTVDALTVKEPKTKSFVSLVKGHTDAKKVLLDLRRV